jgi:CheY-like chemotaxis protein
LARKILLADDSVTAQNMGRKILADAGYDVVTVNNGSAALKRIAELKPDLIVLDVYMPGYSGLEVCQRLKDAAVTAHIPVLLTVGKLEPFKAEEARRVRADAHIVKPFEASELLTAIVRLEERMAPQPAAERDASPDTGWSSRLSFPAKKKKDEEPEDVGAGAAFRDFRREKGKAGADATLPAKAAPPERDPDLASDIPDDVTPEELDALSALAAKLDGLTLADEDSAPPAKQGVEAPAPAVEPAAAADATFAVEPAAFAVEGKSECEIPVENIEPAVESAPLVEVNTAHESQEPAPPAPEDGVVDRNDEPMFASAASAVEQAAGGPSEAEGAAPNDTELTEALRWLTPAGGHADVATVPSHATSGLAAESAACDLSAAPRWVAEPVALSPEEAAISLEAEMFRTFAAMPQSSGVEVESSQISGVSAIAAAVESRLAEADLAASSKALAESCSETTAQEAAAEATAEEAPAEAMAMPSRFDGDQAEKAEHEDSPVNTEQVHPVEFSAAPAEALKAMAAAATADGVASDGDASAIANIVDSVLADLRPKLLEEISKKLTRK